MKYYIIFKDNHFIGYTTDKNLLDNFLNNRKGKYKVKKLNEDEIPDEIRNSFEFSNYELVEYCDYYTTNDAVIFNYEYIDMEEYMSRDCLALQHLLKFVLQNLNLMNFNDEDRKIIQYSFYKLYDDLNAITDSNEVIYDEIININKYLYDRYLPNRKDTKDIIENSTLQDW